MSDRESFVAKPLFLTVLSGEFIIPRAPDPEGCRYTLGLLACDAVAEGEEISAGKSSLSTSFIHSPNWAETVMVTASCSVTPDNLVLSGIQLMAASGSVLSVRKVARTADNSQAQSDAVLKMDGCSDTHPLVVGSSLVRYQAEVAGYAQQFFNQTASNIN